MATYSTVLAWRIPWTVESAGYCPQGRRESDMPEATQHTCTHRIPDCEPYVSCSVKLSQFLEAHFQRLCFVAHLSWEPQSQSSTTGELWFSDVLVPKPLLLFKYEDSKHISFIQVISITVYVNLKVRAEKNFKYLPIRKKSTLCYMQKSSCFMKNIFSGKKIENGIFIFLPIA